MTIPNDDINYENNGQPPEEPDVQPVSSQEEESVDLQTPADEVKEALPPVEETTHDLDFSSTEEDVAAFRRELDALEVPSVTPILEEEPVPEVIPAARRRRRSLSIAERLSLNELGDRLESIIQRTSPTVDFFAFSFLSGCILSIGYILDAPAILIIGIFVAPILGPLVGAALSAATGEIRLFWQSLGGLLVGLAMVFVIGILAGFASRIFQPLTFSQAFFHSRLWWPDLLMLVIGTAVLVITFIHSDEKPIVPSLMVTYEIYLPISAAGFGLGSGIQGLWPQAGLVFLIHLALVFIISLIIFFYMGFRPIQTSGYALTFAITLFGLVVLGGFAGLGNLINVRGDQIYTTPVAAQTATPETSASDTPLAIILAPTLNPTLTPSATSSMTPPPPTATGPVSTATLETTPTVDLSPVATLLPTPVYGRVQALKGDGVTVRIKPGFKSNPITTVSNGYLAEILGDTPVVMDGAIWIHVIITLTNRNIDGWVQSSLIVTATPSISP
jgi:uncharacterized membrane protein